MHITNQKFSFEIFTVGNLLNIFMEQSLIYTRDFWHKIIFDHFDPYNVLLAIATNIPQFCAPGSHMNMHKMSVGTSKC